MAERFENLEDVLQDWANEDVEKSLNEAVHKFQKQEEAKKHVSLWKKWLELEQSQSSETKPLNEIQNVSLL